MKPIEFKGFNCTYAKDPFDEKSNLHIFGIKNVISDFIEISWNSSFERRYSLQTATNLKSTYTTIYTNIYSTAPINRQIITNTSISRFYRLIVE